MSVTSAMFAGASGIAAMSKAMQVISNNIANINTVGFKGSRADFADVLSQSINSPAGKTQIGRGVRLEAVQGLFHQGSFESTPVVTDVAINGTGFFVLSTDAQEIFYTRAGQFRIDKDGVLTSAIGMNVNGFVFDQSGQPTGEVGKINLASTTAPPNQTGDGVRAGSGVFINVNLDASAEVNKGGAGFLITDPNGTSNFSTSLLIFDSLGIPHNLVVYYNRAAEANLPTPAAQPTSDWEWHAVMDGGDLTGGTAKTQVDVGGGTVTFDTNGRLDPLSQTGQVTFNFQGGATQGQVIGFDFSKSTQVGPDPSVTNSLQQDGFSAGFLEAIDIDREGIITGVFSNGVSRQLAQLAIASFPSEVELFRTGNSLFISTVKSGQAIVAKANSGTIGTIAAGTLELSNVDMTEQFVSLISTQRTYQANTKIISTADQMLETIINMKR